MNVLEAEYKRVRPMLGTFVCITVSRNAEPFDQGKVDEVIGEAFSEAERLENIFSRFSSSTTLAKLNHASVDIPTEVEKELYYLLQLAIKIWQSSDSAFNPFFPQIVDHSSTPYSYVNQDDYYLVCKRNPVTLDLSGIAKGYIVDRVVERLRKALPSLSGIVNAGGDLKFFNTLKRCVNLRLGNHNAPVVRTLISPSDCVASSSLSLAQSDHSSSTRYAPSIRKNLTPDHTAVVMAHCCCLADSLTKVALYGEEKIIEACAHQFGARIYIFSPKGAVEESYGEP